MLVRLIGKESIHKIVLPQTVVGNYWINDKTGIQDRKLVNIEGKDDNWIITSSNNAKIIDLKSVNIVNGEIKAVSGNEKFERQIILTENCMYGVYLVNSKEFYIIHCSDLNEDNLTRYDIRHTQEIRIGRGMQSHICYENNLVSDYHARIVLNNGRLLLENYDTNFGTFVNSKKIEKESWVLFNGDVIFIMGLKIIVMGNSLFINNPKNMVKINNTNLVLSSVRREKPIISENEDDDAEVDLYSDKEYYSRAPRITNVIETEKVKIDAPPQLQDKQETPMILVLGSTISMGAMMMISMINTIDSGRSGNGDKKQMVFSLIMTAIMLIAIMVFPILNIIMK